MRKADQRDRRGTSRGAASGRAGEPKRFNIKMQKKLAVLFIMVLLAFAGLSVRLVWITREDGEQYSRQVLSQQRYDSTTLPYRRGDIVDAKGTSLAVSEKVYNLVIDSRVIMYNNGKYYEPTMEALEQCFDLDMAAIRQYVTSHAETSSYYVPIKRMSYEQIQEFQELQSQKNSQIRGIWFEEEYKRVYPQGSLACDVVGFATADNEGTNGLEAYYNDVLNGTTGREFGYLTEDATLERTVHPAVDGYTIHTTLDANIQSVLEKYLLEFNETHKNAVRTGNGAENVAGIIMDLNSGNILAMASYPVYDLNNPRDTAPLLGNVMVDEVGNKVKPTKYISQEDLDGMDENLLYQNLNALWRNFCIADTYEPGSTAKPFTVAAGLEAGILEDGDTFLCEGVLEVGGHQIHCHTRWGDGTLTVQQAVAYSCNVALMKMASRIGADTFSKFQQVFQFGLKTNIDLAGEARTASLLKSASDMDAADLATYSFGQNFNVTMIQMIAGFSSLINGGYYYEPHVVDRITNSSGATVQNIEPRILKQTVSESTSELIRKYCRAVVMPEGGDSRTGKTARPAGYAIGGKTGTAQTLPRGNGEYVVSFMGYAPADDPQIAIYVVVDRPNAAKQDDAKFATGIVRNVLTEVLPYLNIYMTEELTEEEVQELAERKLAITNMYAATPEAEDLEDTQKDGEQDAQDGGTDPDQGQEPAWKSFPIDPVTGYRRDPSTGALVDPDTGDLVEEDFPALGDL